MQVEGPGQQKPFHLRQLFGRMSLPLNLPVFQLSPLKCMRDGDPSSGFMLQKNSWRIERNFSTSECFITSVMLQPNLLGPI